MEKFKNATRFLFTLVIFLPMALTADEGWWTRAKFAGGALYAKTEHPDIALEKEVLLYYGEGAVEAFFLFKNTSGKNMTVDVGFPVKIVIPNFRSEYFGPSIALLRNIYGYTYEPASDRAFKIFIEKIRANPNSDELNIQKMMSWSAFLHLNQFWREDLVHNLTILQDGSTVAIDSVFLEAKLVGKDTLAVDFHFLHRLTFRPRWYTTVVVKYASFSRIMSSGSALWTDLFHWRYVLGTGKTWKGQIGTIYVLAPNHLQPKLPLFFSTVGDFQKKTIFIAKEYEPGEEDEIECINAKFGQATDGAHVNPIMEVMNKSDSVAIIESIQAPRGAAQPFVAVKQASSYLRQRTRINSFQNRIIPQNDAFWQAIYHPRYFKMFYERKSSQVMKYVVEAAPITCGDIGFGPVSLFDGIPESAWCEGVDGPGIGEWVAFELKDDMLGLAVYNGFKKARWCSCMEEFKQGEWILDEKGLAWIDSIYANNNQVKLLEIVSDDGKFNQWITLKDSPNRQIFDDIFLPKGAYKIYIREIYKGVKWDDTCLGEIDFFRANGKWLVDKDEFLRKVFE